MLLFDPETGDLSFDFTLDTNITEPSVAYLNEEYYYPKGVDIKIKADNGTYLTPEIDQQGNYHSFMITDEALNGTLIRVSVSAVI